MVAITKGTVTQAVKRLINSLDGEGGLRLCVLPDGFKENKLVKTLREMGFACVPSRYVSILDWSDS